MKGQMDLTLRAGLMALVLPLLFSCTSKQDDLAHYIAEVKARPAAPIPPIPPVKTYKPYKYDGLAGRDPFRSSSSEGNDQVVARKKGTGPHPNFKRAREYLERFDLDTLTMVGTFSKERYHWALIRDPDGVVHRVSVGNYMGKNYGKVISVRPNQVALTEFVPDGSGNWLVRDASMALGGK